MKYIYTSDTIVSIDKYIFFYNTSINRKNTTFFYYNNRIHLVNNINFKKHLSFHCWIYFHSKIFGLNKNIIQYILTYSGCNINIFYTHLEEYSFSFLRSFLKYYHDYFSLSWFLTYLKERTVLLPFTHKGIRYLKKLPSRGQRTRSNYESSKKRKELPHYEHFTKRLTTYYKDTHFPSWNKMETFFFHRY